jgi:hypothetical protein
VTPCEVVQDGRRGGYCRFRSTDAFCFLRDVMIYNLEGAAIADSAATLIFRMSKSSSGPVD